MRFHDVSKYSQKHMFSNSQLLWHSQLVTFQGRYLRGHRWSAQYHRRSLGRPRTQIFVLKLFFCSPYFCLVIKKCSSSLHVHLNVFVSTISSEKEIIVVKSCWICWQLSFWLAMTDWPGTDQLRFELLLGLQGSILGDRYRGPSVCSRVLTLLPSNQSSLHWCWPKKFPIQNLLMGL